MARRALLLSSVLVVLAALAAGPAAAVAPTKPVLLVGVSASGGFCRPNACHWEARITTSTINADGRRPRRLTVAERKALLLAITQLKPASLPPFTGTCPIAYDGQEFAYRFRGKRALRSCTYDLRRVRAVQLVNRLVASLRSV